MLMHRGIYIYCGKDIYECMLELHKFYVNVTKIVGLEKQEN